MSASPVIPCDCGCWPDLASAPEVETWMALYLDLLDRDHDAAMRMFWDYVGPRLRLAMSPDSSAGASDAPSADRGTTTS